MRIPSYRHHKGSGQAFVQVKGERFYLGKHGSDESREKYRRFVAELTASPISAAMTPIDPGVKGLRVVELCAAYWKFAEGYYVRGFS